MRKISNMISLLRKWIKQFLRWNNLMTYDWEELDWNNIEELREYAKANMSEGYLSASEEAFLNKVFNELEKLREQSGNAKKVVEKLAKVIRNDF